MELNQTAPPPSSPVMDTKGHNPCSINVTYVAVGAVMLLICLCGLAGNGAVLWILGFHIRRNPITIYILNLAVADFTFLLFMVLSTLLYLPLDISCFAVLPLKYVRLLFQLSLLPYNMGLYLLTAISIERCVSILFPLWHRCHRSECQSGVVCVLLWALCIAVTAVVTSLCLSHEYEHCRVALISMYTLSFFIFALPMVISNMILFIKVLCGSKRRQPKRVYIVIFLIVLFFLIFLVPLSLCNFLYLLSHTVVFCLLSPLLACINSSINPFIYFLVGSCWRRCSIVSLQVAFRRVFEEAGITTISSRETTVVPPAVLPTPASCSAAHPCSQPGLQVTAVC